MKILSSKHCINWDLCIKGYPHWSQGSDHKSKYGNTGITSHGCYT